MEIYFAASIRGGRDDRQLYERLITFLNQQHHVLTEHIGNPNLTADGETELSDQEIRDRDVAWLTASDVVVAEATHPSLGVGYELAMAEQLKKPTIILYRPQVARLSAMIAGTSFFNRIYGYETVEEAEKILEREIATIE